MLKEHEKFMVWIAGAVASLAGGSEVNVAISDGDAIVEAVNTRFPNGIDKPND